MFHKNFKHNFLNVQIYINDKIMMPVTNSLQGDSNDDLMMM